MASGALEGLQKKTEAGRGLTSSGRSPEREMQVLGGQLAPIAEVEVLESPSEEVGQV